MAGKPQKGTLIAWAPAAGRLRARSPRGRGALHRGRGDVALVPEREHVGGARRTFQRPLGAVAVVGGQEDLATCASAGRGTGRVLWGVPLRQFQAGGTLPRVPCLGTGRELHFARADIEPPTVRRAMGGRLLCGRVGHQVIGDRRCDGQQESAHGKKRGGTIGADHLLAPPAYGFMADSRSTFGLWVVRRPIPPMGYQQHVLGCPHPP